MEIQIGDSGRESPQVEIGVEIGGDTRVEECTCAVATELKSRVRDWVGPRGVAGDADGAV